jgi:hypothetical protein
MMEVDGKEEGESRTYELSFLSFLLFDLVCLGERRGEAASVVVVCLVLNSSCSMMSVVVPGLIFLAFDFKLLLKPMVNEQGDKLTLCVNVFWV